MNLTVNSSPQSDVKSSKWYYWVFLTFVPIIFLLFNHQYKNHKISKSGDGQYRDEIHLSFLSIPRHMNPTELVYSEDFLLLQAVFDTLTRIDESGRAVASLAKRWSVDVTGTVYTFELHPEAKFHHGNPIGSRDVAYSLASHFWPGSKSVVKSYMEDILMGAKNVKKGELPSGLTILGPHTISFRLVGPYAPFLSVLAMPAFCVYPKDWDFSKAPNGSGPMMARFIEDSQCWQLERYEDYLGAKPSTKVFHITALPSLKDILKEFQKGELDLAMGFDYSSLDPENKPAGVEILKTNSAIIRHLYLNPDHPLLKSKEFRQNLTSLIHGVVKEPSFLSPFMNFGPHFISKGILPDRYYARTLTPMTPDEFKQKWGKIAKTHELHFLLSKGIFIPARLKELHKALTAAGLHFKLETPSNKNMLEAHKSKAFDVIGLGYVGNFYDPDGFLDYLQEGSIFKKLFAPSRELFQKIAKARFIKNPVERLNAYTDALLQFENQYYVIPLFHINSPILHRKGIHLPDTSYRYEIELRNIYWQADDSGKK